MHSVRGITQDGIKVNIKLRPNKKYERSPTISEFSDTSVRDNHNQCVADNDNSPQNRHGVLLFTNCVRDPVRKKTNDGYENYISSWGTVICADKNSPDFIQGLGRIDIRKGMDELADLHHKYHTESDNEKKDKYAKQISEMPVARLPLIIYRYKLIRRFHLENIADGKEYLKETLGKILDANVGCGFAIRLLDQNHQIYKNSYREVFQNFIKEEDRLESPEEMIERYFSTPHATSMLEQGDFEVDLIPLEKVFSGKVTTRYYLRKNNYRMIRSLYTTGTYGTKVCNVLAKTFKFKDELAGAKRLLMDRVFSMSSPLGHPMRITVDGNCNMTMVGENPNGYDYSSVFKAEFPSKRNELKRNAFIYNFMTSGEIDHINPSEKAIKRPEEEIKKEKVIDAIPDQELEPKTVEVKESLVDESLKNKEYESEPEDIKRVDEIKERNEKSIPLISNTKKPDDTDYEKNISSAISLPNASKPIDNSEKEESEENELDSGVLSDNVTEDHKADLDNNVSVSSEVEEINPEQSVNDEYLEDKLESNEDELSNFKLEDDNAENKEDEIISNEHELAKEQEDNISHDQVDEEVADNNISDHLESKDESTESYSAQVQHENLDEDFEKALEKSSITIDRERSSNDDEDKHETEEASYLHKEDEVNLESTEKDESESDNSHSESSHDVLAGDNKPEFEDNADIPQENFVEQDQAEIEPVQDEVESKESEETENFPLMFDDLEEYESYISGEDEPEDEDEDEEETSESSDAESFSDTESEAENNQPQDNKKEEEPTGMAAFLLGLE